MNRLLEYCSLQKVSLLVVLLSMSFLEVSAFVDSTGLAGDHFSLEGALELFKKAKSPEAFEKLLNQEDQSINNLDLNEDNQVDYIRVIDHMKDNVHALVLQVPLNENESQDIAVIEIEKTGRESAILQIIGDPDVYGEEIIVEPFEEEGQGGKGGPDIEEMRVARVVVNVWFWPSVRFVFAPGYRVWVSPWRWARYPTWYRPWRPLAWRVYQPRTVVYRSRFHVVSTHRVIRAHRIYTPVRIYSPTVKSRTTRVVKTNGHKTVVTKRTTTRGVGVTGNKAVTKKNTSTTIYNKNTGNSITRKKSTTAGINANRGVFGKKTTKSTTLKKSNGNGGTKINRTKSTTFKKRKRNR